MRYRTAAMRREDYPGLMVKFLIGLVTGVALVFLSVLLLFVVALRFRDSPPTIADNSALILRLSGDLPEKPPMELPSILGEDHTPVTVIGVWSTLEKAAADSRVKAVVLQPEGLSASWAKLQELRLDIDKFKKSGKPVFAYLRQPGTREYYVAAGADRIYLGPSEPVMLKGLRAEMMYFKNSLDKLGVNVEIEHAGKYKDFGDMFTRSDMSPETREVMTTVVDELYGDIVATIAAGRKRTPDEVRAIIDQGPFTAPQALKAGLVDELRFEDQMWGELKDKLKVEPAKLSMDKYSKITSESLGLSGKNRIAVVVGEGDIVRGSPGDDGAADTNLTSYGFNKLLRRVEADSSIKGVVVRIDSPGGEVTASDELWRQMNLLSKKKPVVISMSGAAASGGYFMAMTGDPIVAYPGTLTGSIGVVFGKPNLHGLYDKLGVTKDAIQRGKHAGIDSDYTPLTPDERATLRAGIDESYRDFVTKVAEARHRKFEEIEPLAQGRVWLGSQAKERGLVDEVGGIDKAIEIVKQKAKIPNSERVGLVVYPGRRNILDLILKKSKEDMLEAKLSQVLGRLPVRAWLRGGMLRMMPFWFEVR
ncbi:MAG: signal peptide peptidase SppA [Candidatus Solibacter sp.]